MSESKRYHFTLWGRSPGYGYESGWAFGRTPELAVKDALADARKYSAHKWKLPADVYLQPDSGHSLAFHVAADGAITEGHASRDVFGRSRRPAVRIRKSRRRKVESEIEAMVRHGYSPKYAAQKAYHPRAHRDIPRADLVRALRKDQADLRKTNEAIKRLRRGERVENWSLTSARQSAAGLRLAIRNKRKALAKASRDCVGIHTHENLGHAMLEKHGRDPGRLTAAGRRRLRPRQFALPAREALPLDTPKRIRSAASRLEQMRRRGTVTASEYRRAHARIRAAEKRHGIGPFHHRRRR